MASVDMGTATGHVDLDVSGVTEGARKAKEAFDAIDKASEKSISDIDKYAQSLEDILAGGYKDLARSSEQVKAAEEAVAKVFESNQQKVQDYADAILSAETKQMEAARQVASLQQTLNTYESARVAQAEKYAELTQKQGVTVKQLENQYRKLQTALDQENLARQNLAQAMDAEKQATKQVQQAKTAYHNAENAAIRSNLTAQKNVQRVEEETATLIVKNASKQLQYIEKNTQAYKNSVEERKRLREEEQRAAKEAERAAKEQADSQAMVFAVANNAVHETINLVKRLAQEMFNLGKQILQVGSDFEQSMAQVAATSGMSAADVANNISEYNDLVEAAKEAGATTMFTATQAGEALNYLALAGYNVQESIDTMPDILTIAAAGAMDLGQASDMVTDAMNALNLEIDQTGEFIDKMARTAQSSNTNVEQLGKSILTVGGTATVLAGGVTELDTAIGLMANSGIKAQQAGTSLRQIILNLTAPASTGAKKIEELGLKVFDLDGKMRPLNEIFQDLNTIMADFTDQERMDAMNDIFDARHIRSANALLQQCGKEWDELAAKIDNADGAAEQMAETMMSTFKGSITIAKSILESIAITINEGLRKNLTDMVNEAIPRFQKLNDTLASSEISQKLEILSAQIKDIALNVLDTLIAGVPKILDFLIKAKTYVEELIVVITTLLALKLAVNIQSVITALGALVNLLITNPYVAVAAAVAVLVLELKHLAEQTEATRQATIKAIEEENDAYRQQRSEVQAVVDEWNSYKETSGQVVAEAEVQKEKVAALYEEYERLYHAGEDTTLAMEALANEIPELKTMLAEGKTSFQDITTAVNDYKDALIKAAYAEAYKEDYTQAIKTRTKLADSIDELKDRYLESGRALARAETELANFDTVWGGLDLAFNKDLRNRRQELENEVTARRNIYAADVAAYSQASTALKEANEEVDRTEQLYLSTIEKSTQEEVGAYEDRNGDIKGVNRDYLNYLKSQGDDVSDTLKQNTQQAADTLTASVNQMKAQMQLRKADDDDLLEMYESFFGSNQWWDRNNEDMRNHYDKYMTLREKKEKEVRDQMEKDQKERDKLAKETQQKNEKAAKEAEDAWVKSINKGLSDIEWLAGYEDWDGKQLTDAYKKYLDDNMDYYESHAEARESLERKILNTEKDYNKKQADESKKAAEKYVKNWTDGYDALIDRADKAYKQLQSDYDKYRNNLLKGTEITAQETKKVWDAVTSSYKEEKVEGISSAKSLKENTKQMEQVAQFIDQMQAKMGDAAAESFMSEFMGLDAKAQEDWMKQWSKMSSGQQQEWINAWKDNQAKADELSDKYFADSLEAWKENYWKPVQDYAATGGTELKQAMELAGEDSVQGWVDGIQEKYDEAEGIIKDLYGDVLQDSKDALGIASPSKKFYEIGEFSIDGFLAGIQSKIDQVGNIFANLGQTAGDKFVNAFKSTWDNFIALLNSTGGLPVPVSMTTTAFGTPVTQGAQVYYTGTGTSYSGLTKADVTSAIKEAIPNGDVVLKVGESELGRVSRKSLNTLAEQQGTLDLRV